MILESAPVPFLLRAAGWIGVHLTAMVAGVFIGGALTPKVNPHNDWGTTGMVYALVGALAGSSGVIVLIMWRYEQRALRGKQGSRQDRDV